MDDSDFFPIGDEGVIIITTVSEYGEGTYGEGTYGGGEETIIISGGETVWTEIDEP